MPTYNSTIELKDSIRHLEVNRELQLKHMKETFGSLMDNLTPKHIIQNTYQSVKSSHKIGELVVGFALAITGGYLVRKLLFRGPGNIIRKILGIASQSAATYFISKYSLNFKVLFNRLFQEIKGKEKVWN